jgi:hypothetical protein
MRALGILLALAVVAAPGSWAWGATDDRLARFRELGLRYAEVEAEDDASALAEALFEVVDAEILENLASGEPFASAPFIQERLEAFTGTWGGMSLRLASSTARSALVAILGLASSTPVGSLRFYGAGEGGPRLLASVTHPGRPETYPWPTAERGTARVAASWLGTGAPGAGHALWIEVWELRADREAAPVWRSATPFPEGLVATGFAIRGGQITVRYPARYAGFKVGCEAQTEQEDVYRARPAGGPVALTSRRVSNPWHREVSAAADQLFLALASGDRRTLERLVPDARVRGRLPAHLRPDGACDERAGGGRAAVVAATETRGDALRPWVLRFARAGPAWRLTAATPVLQ